MTRSEMQRQNSPDTNDNTDGGFNIIPVSSVTSKVKQSEKCKHIDNTHGGLQETHVISVTTSSEGEEIGSTSIVSNIYQGNGADTISQGSQEDLDDMEDNNDDVGDFDTSQLNISDRSLVEDANLENESEQDADEQDVESEEDDENPDEYSIPVHTDNNRPDNNSEARARVLTTVKIVSKRTEASMELPTVAVTNFRSLEPKLNNVTSDIIERELDIVLGSETWQKDSNKTLKASIEKLLEEHGLAFKSCPRPSTKRGGGSAVIVNTKKFTVEKLSVFVPHKLEVVWCLVRPKEVHKNTTFKEIIVAFFYSAPNYRKNNK